MLKRLLDRLRQPKPRPAVSAASRAPASPAAASSPEHAAPATRPPTPEPTSFDQAGQSAAGWHLVARRPLIDPHGAIAGWDLRLSDWAMQRLVRAGAPRALQETYAFALLRAVQDTARSGRHPLVTLAGAGTADAVLPSLAPGAIVVLGDGSGNAASALTIPRETVRAAGIKLAAAPEVVDLVMADYGLLDGARMGTAEVLRRCLQPCPAPGGWIATNLASFEDVVEAVRRRVTLACGRMADGTEQQRRGEAPAAALRVASLITAVVRGRAPRELADLIKADVTLSHRLLRHLTMAGIGQGRVPQSIQDAILLLGNRELHRWLCVLLGDAGVSPISTALHETALTRGRLLELLGQSRGESSPEQLFVLGAFSLLDLLLDVPLDAALALTPLPAPVVDALISETGPWRPYLETALAIEAGEPDRLDRACAQLGVAREKTLALYEAASRWGAEAARIDR